MYYPCERRGHRHHEAPHQDVEDAGHVGEGQLVLLLGFIISQYFCVRIVLGLVGYLS